MTMEKHTPGPHTVEQIGRRPLMIAVAATVLSRDRERLADFRHVADANLFAAAPDLIEALRKVDADWTEAFPDGPDGDRQYLGGFGELSQETIVVWRSIRAAIAKIEGK